MKNVTVGRSLVYLGLSQVVGTVHKAAKSPS